MEIIDIAIIIIIIFGGLVGIKRGFIKQFVCSVGSVLSVILAFVFKNSLSMIFYENLPFFKFGGVLKGVTVLNIVLYELIAFMLVLLALSIIFKILAGLSSFIEKVLTASLIFGIPSKILGAILGLIESYVLVFILLFIFTLPVFQFNNYIMEHSKWSNDILTSTPILSNYTDDTINMIDEFNKLKDKYKESSNPNQFNKEALNVLLKYKIVTVDSIDTLVKKDKIKIDAIEEVLSCYRNNTCN